METIIEEDGWVFQDLMLEGAVFTVRISWDCNLDTNDRCRPTYDFDRIDDPKSHTSPGYNFRYARYKQIDGKAGRDLYKVYGVRFVFVVNGVARKFNAVILFTTIGGACGGARARALSGPGRRLPC